jgi:hypothetical protein
LDVSVEETSICIVDDTGRIVREVKVASEPEALLAVLKNPAYLRLSEMPREVLRVECLRCLRVVEIRKMDAIRLCGPHAIWKDVGQRLLDNDCQQRTGRHEQDGCWPNFIA